MKIEENNPLQTPKEENLGAPENLVNSPNEKLEPNSERTPDPKDTGSKKTLQYFSYPILAFFITLLGDMIIGSVMMMVGFSILFAMIFFFAYFCCCWCCLICCYCYTTENKQETQVIVNSAPVIHNHQTNVVNQHLTNNNYTPMQQQGLPQTVSAETIEVQNKNKDGNVIVPPSAPMEPDQIQTLCVKDSESNCNNNSNKEVKNFHSSEASKLIFSATAIEPKKTELCVRNEANDIERNILIVPPPPENSNVQQFPNNQLPSVNIGGIQNNQVVNNNVNVVVKNTTTTRTSCLCNLFAKAFWGLALVIYGFVDSIVAVYDTVKDIKSNKISTENDIGANLKIMGSRCCQFITKNKILNF